AQLGAVHVFSFAGRARLRIQLAQLGIRLALRIVIHPDGRPLSAEATATLWRAGCHLRPAAASPLLRTVGVAEPAYLCAPVKSQLRLDPIDGGAIAVRALAPVAKAGEGLDGCLVTLEIQARHKLSGRVCRYGRSDRRLGRGQRMSRQRSQRAQRARGDDSRYCL